jgi:site-specific recombinase XerD
MVLERRPSRPAKTPSLDKALHEFLLDGRARQFTAPTLDHYRSRLGSFVQWAAAQDDAPATVADVTPRLLRSYLVSLQERNLASNTQHTHARAVRAFLNFCKREGWLKQSPFDAVKMPRADKVEKLAFSDEDVRRLLRACDTARERALLLVLMDTGIRATELCNLDVADVDLDTQAVTVRLGKGRKDRTTYLGARAARAVSRYLAERTDATPSTPLFVSESNRNVDGRLTRSGLRRILDTIGKRAGVADVHPHRFRRTFATWSLRGGMSVYALARLMGHSDIATLRRYLALVEADLQRAHEQVGPVDKMLK